MGQTNIKEDAYYRTLVAEIEADIEEENKMQKNGYEKALAIANELLNTRAA